MSFYFKGKSSFECLDVQFKNVNGSRINGSVESRVDLYCGVPREQGPHSEVIAYTPHHDLGVHSLTYAG